MTHESGEAAVTLLRHATVLVELGDERMLVDPMLDPPGARGPVAGTPAQRDNPLVALPPGADDLLARATAAVVTHLHADHLDEAGARWLAGARLPTFGQAEDVARLTELGVADVEPLGENRLGAVRLHRTGGRHGVGALADRLGPVSGVVLEHGPHRIYVAGDTVRCAELDAACARFEPTTIVVNAGGARFTEGEPITMTAADVAALATEHPAAAVVAVHMDAINHCLDTREVLRARLAADDVADVRVPGDGERVPLVP